MKFYTSPGHTTGWYLDVRPATRDEVVGNPSGRLRVSIFNSSQWYETSFFMELSEAYALKEYLSELIERVQPQPEYHLRSLVKEANVD